MTTQLGDLHRTAPGYNGGPTGPTLRAKPGDKVRITLVNNLVPSPPEHLELTSFINTDLSMDDDPAKLNNQTLIVNRLKYPTGNFWSLSPEEYWGKSFQNLHFHGLPVDPTVDDGKVYIDGGGNKITYEFDIPEDTPPPLWLVSQPCKGNCRVLISVWVVVSGELIVYTIAWCMECTPIFIHLFLFVATKCFSGAFVVEDPDSGLTKHIASTPQASEHFLLLSMSKTDDSGTPVNFHSMVLDFEWDHLTNGMLNPTLNFKKRRNRLLPCCWCRY